MVSGEEADRSITETFTALRDQIAKECALKEVSWLFLCGTWRYRHTFASFVVIDFEIWY